MKKIFLVITILIVSLGLVAQQRRVSAYIFQPEWYAGGQIGVNSMIAEGFPKYNLLDASNIQGRFLLGYNFSPVFGIRSGLTIANYTWPKVGSTIVPVSFGAQSVNADLVLNVTNSFFGYDLYYRTDFSLFAGAGAVHRNKADFISDYYSYLLRGGAQFDYRLTQFWDFNLIAEMNITGDNFNNIVGSADFEILSALMVGFTYHFRTNKPFGRGCCN